MLHWTCPICQLPLLRLGQSSACERGHSFDTAKEGYINLLTSNQKHSLTPGDSAAMIAARRTIHNAELYEPLAEVITSTIRTHLTSGNVLDVGCGEGFYTGKVQLMCPNVDIAGVDISKPAIRIAAKTYKTIHYAVASSNNLPIGPSSVDFVFNVFAPTNDNETNRVLADAGFLLEVGPAPGHLSQLRAALYETPRKHKELRSNIAGLKLADSGQLEYVTALDKPLIRAMIEATPMAHRGDPRNKEALFNRESMAIDFAFSWRLYEKTHN